MTSPEVDVADTANLLRRSNEVERPGDRCCRRRRRKRDWFFVEPVLMAYFFCEFPTMIVAQVYALEWIRSNMFHANSSRPSSPTTPCDPNITDDERRFDDRVQSLTSLFTVVKSAVWGIPAVIMAILLGAGSDRLGRRFAILPPLLGVFFSSLVLYAVIRTHSSVIFFLVGDFLYGCCGSATAMAMSCYAYVADRTPADRRMLRITLLQLCMLVAGSVSPMAVGPLIGLIGVENVLLAVICITVVNFAYVFVFLRSDDRNVDEQRALIDGQNDVRSRSYTDNEDGPGLTESVNKEPGADLDSSERALSTAGSGDRHHAPRFRHAVPRSDDDAADSSRSLNSDNTQPRSELAEPRTERQTRTLCDDFRSAFSLFLSPSRHRARLNILMTAFFISILPTFDFSVSTLFEMNRPLCWTVREIGMFTGVSLAVSAVGALIVTPAMKKCATDWHIAITAAVAGVITYGYKFFVRDSLMMYLSLSLTMFAILIIPSIRSMMSALVSDHEQGAVFGAIASVEGLCMVLGVVIFNTIYSKTLAIASGFVFLVMAGFYAVSCLLLLVYHIRTKLEARHQQLQRDEPA